MMKIAVLFCALICWAAFSQAPAAAADAPAVSARQFPPGFFHRQQKTSLKEKEQILAKIEATLELLNDQGQGLIAKGALIDRPGTDRKVYDTLTILDESGLIIMAHKVPNLYYRYAGPAPLNPNIYLILKNARLNVPESYRRYGFVVEGDYLAYAQKFVAAITGNLEVRTLPEESPPGGPRR